MSHIDAMMSEARSRIDLEINQSVERHLQEMRASMRAERAEFERRHANLAVEMREKFARLRALFGLPESPKSEVAPEASRPARADYVGEV